MLRIQCPICGERDHAEFDYGSDATVTRPAQTETDLQLWLGYVFFRGNPRGPHREYWHHVNGCRQWLIVDRDTLTHEISRVVLSRDAGDLPKKAVEQ